MGKKATIFSSKSRAEAEAEARRQGRDAVYRAPDGWYVVGRDDEVAAVTDEDTRGILINKK
jgi:hypothetical protein